jgi:hypothetical protein
MMAAGRRRLFVVVVGIEDRVGRRRVVVLAWTVWLLAPLGGRCCVSDSSLIG